MEFSLSTRNVICNRLSVCLSSQIFAHKHKRSILAARLPADGQDESRLISPPQGLFDHFIHLNGPPPLSGLSFPASLSLLTLPPCLCFSKIWATHPPTTKTIIGCFPIKKQTKKRKKKKGKKTACQAYLARALLCLPLRWSLYIMMKASNDDDNDSKYSSMNVKNYVWVSSPLNNQCERIVG